MHSGTTLSEYLTGQPLGDIANWEIPATPETAYAKADAIKARLLDDHPITRREAKNSKRYGFGLAVSMVALSVNGLIAQNKSEYNESYGTALSWSKNGETLAEIGQADGNAPGMANYAHLSASGHIIETADLRVDAVGTALADLAAKRRPATKNTIVLTPAP